jgi:CBS domain-containing protein
MRVAEVMSRGVEPVDPAMSVQEAAVQMAEFDIGAVLVGAGGALTGVLTDRDIILRVVVEGKNPADVKVGEVMSELRFTCHEDDTVEAVFSVMRERQIRRMPVYNAAGEPVGVVALSDLAKALSGEPEQVRETLREMSEPHRSRKARGADADQDDAMAPAEEQHSPPATANS